MSKQVLPYKSISSPRKSVLLLPREVSQQAKEIEHGSHEQDKVSYHAQLLHRETSRILALDPLILRELHVIPTPLANHQHHPLLDVEKDMDDLCHQSYIRIVKDVAKLKNLRALR
jgi:hypothetical protein